MREQGMGSGDRRLRRSLSVRARSAWTILGIAACLLANSPAAADEWRETTEIAELVNPPAELVNPPAAPAQAKPTRIDPFWSDLPTTRIFPRPGNFFTPPTGPGYYSALDCWQGNYRQSPPPYPYPPFALMPPGFFDANFRFLDDPEKHWGLTDWMKRREVGCNWLVSSGGSFWWRYMNETNSRGSGVNQDYDLIRTRVYGDVSYLDHFRFYVEMLDAHRFGGELPPLPIDVNRHDLLNVFVDINVLQVADKPVYARIGRQELLLGSQRLISTLDWANTRRTFEGVRVFRQGDQWDWDVFWTQFVPPDPVHFDRADHNQNFAGGWATYRPKPGHFMDFYYLYFGHGNPPPQPLPADESHVHTLGTRYVGDRDNWRWDIEAMFQFGERGDQDIAAGAVAVGGGYHFADLPMNPQVWAYYDYASGDRNPGAGRHTTFNQLYPFGHYYLGFVDLVGRQNIHDVNLHLFLYPANWITFWAQYHHLNLDQSRDALYNAAGLPIRRDATGQSGRHVGDELDLLVNFHLGPHSDLLVGWSKLYAGEFFRSTGPGTSPELFYTQYNVRW